MAQDNLGKVFLDILQGATDVLLPAYASRLKYGQELGLYGAKLDLEKKKEMEILQKKQDLVGLSPAEVYKLSQFNKDMLAPGVSQTGKLSGVGLDILKESAAKMQELDYFNKKRAQESLTAGDIEKYYGMTAGTTTLPSDELLSGEKLKLFTQQLADERKQQAETRAENRMYDYINFREAAKETAKIGTENRQEINKIRQNLNANVGDITKMYSVLNKIDDLNARVGDFDPGFVGQTWARVSTAAKKYGADKDITELTATVNKDLVPLARILQGVKGRLSNLEITQVAEGLGKVYQPLQIRKDLVDSFRSDFNIGVKSIFDMLGGVDQLRTDPRYSELIDTFERNRLKELDIKARQ